MASFVQLASTSPSEGEVERQAMMLKSKITALDSLISLIPNAEHLASEVALSAQIERNQEKREHEKEVLKFARERLKRRSNVFKLLSHLLFFALYSAVLLLQHSDTDSYSIERHNVPSLLNVFSADSVIMSNVMSSLPSNGQGASFLNGGGPGSTGLLSANDDFHSWFQGSIVDVLFRDAVCGDGVCSFPEEIKAVGRFGCAADCGRVSGDTVVNIRVDVSYIFGNNSCKRARLIVVVKGLYAPCHDGSKSGRCTAFNPCGKNLKIVAFRQLKTVMQSRYLDAIDLGDLEPKFKYNIFSKKFNDYVFEKHMAPSAVEVQIFEALKSDSLELHLFQINSLSNVIDVKDIEFMYHFGAGTVPARSTTLPWGYGDWREVLAVSQFQSKKVQDYCLNRMGDVYNARINDPICSDASLPYPNGMPNYFTPLSTALQMMSSYGIMGDITVTSVNEFGKRTQISLIRSPGTSTAGPALRFCSPLPASINFSSDTLPTGMDFVDLIQTTNAKCSLSSERRLKATSHDQAKYVTRKAADQQLFDSYNDVNSTTLNDNYFPLAEPVRVNSVTSRNLLSDSNSNPLSLTLTDVGADDRGFWKCHTGPSDPSKNPQCWSPDAQWYFDARNLSNVYGYQGSVFAAVDISYDFIEIFNTDPKLSAAVEAWKVGKGLAPTLAGASLELRYAVDGESQNLEIEDCSSPFIAPRAVKSFEYNFKSRLRLWGTNSTQIKVWLCNLTLSPAAPEYVSLLDIRKGLSNEGFSPLQPGPVVLLNLSLMKNMPADEIQTFQQQICLILWSTQDERCKSRSWTAVTPFDSAWDIRNSNRQREGESSNLNPWQLQVFVLSISNADASRASDLLTAHVNSKRFETQFSNVDLSYPAQAKVLVPGPPPKLAQSSQYGCVSHHDCAEGLFCSSNSMAAFAQGFQGGSGSGSTGFGCDLCQYCLSNSMDAVDGSCPKDKCGRKSGSYPDCINASQMFAIKPTCPSIYPLYMNRIPATGKITADLVEVPISSPNSTKRKARFLTPYNQILNALIITQSRKSGACIFANDSVSNYARLKVPSLGAVCRGKEVDNKMFGNDPAFVSLSTLFRGDLEPSKFYKSSETDSSSLPFGFFPHSYNQRDRQQKDSKYIVKADADLFKIYFTEKLTHVTASRFASFLRDGKFLDQNTESIKVEIPTLNSNLNFFCLNEFNFVWESGGKITWDYQIASFPIYQYEANSLIWRVLLDVLVVLRLFISSLSECAEIGRAVRKFDLMVYFRDKWNIIDLAHLSLMWIGWVLWMRQVYMGSNLNMLPGYNILASPAPETPARILATNPEGEYRYIQFIQYLKDMSSNLSLYNNLTSLCVLLFMLRSLKAADFQPRIALVTRTLSNATTDLLHFLTLYCIVLLSYAIAGVLLFGHQYESYKTLPNAIFSLIIVMIAWDPSQWNQMNHASSQYSFSIFLWTWIFLAMFILLNILLAILVEGYMTAKSYTDKIEAPGLLTDIAGVISHEINRIIKIVRPSYAFISDDELVSKLSAKLGETEEDALDQDSDQEGGTELTPILLSDGDILDNKQMFGIIKELIPEAFQANSSADMAAVSDPYVNSVVRDLMRRFGSSKNLLSMEEKQKSRIDSFKELCRLQAMKQLTQLHLSQLCGGGTQHLVSSDGEYAPPVVEYATLRVVIEGARNLPRIDCGAGADVYCVVFLEGASQIYRTEVRRGRSEVSWVWNEDLFDQFVWRLPKGSELLEPDRNVVVLVYDKDQFSSDDLMGSARVTLGELNDGVFDDWKSISRPTRSGPQQFLLWPVSSSGELKIRVTLLWTDSRLHPPDNRRRRSSINAGNKENWKSKSFRQDELASDLQGFFKLRSESTALDNEMALFRMGPTATRSVRQGELVFSHQMQEPTIKQGELALSDQTQEPAIIHSVLKEELIFSDELQESIFTHSLRQEEPALSDQVENSKFPPV